MRRKFFFNGWSKILYRRSSGNDAVKEFVVLDIQDFVPTHKVSRICWWPACRVQRT